MWGMGSNPWVQEPAPPEPVGDGEEALGVDYRRWAAEAEVSASRRLGHVSAGGRVCGSSGLMAGRAPRRGRVCWMRDAGQSWPVPAASGDGVRAVVTARTCAASLEAARAAAVEWVEGACPGVELVGLLLGADAPGKRPKALHRRVRDVSGPSPWCWACRGSRPGS